MIAPATKIFVLACAVLIGLPVAASPTYSITDLGLDGSLPDIGFTPAPNALPGNVTLTSAVTNPNVDYSFTVLSQMNANGLAAGFNYYGVSGHDGFSQAVVAQRQPDGSWGSPQTLWPGAETFGGATTNNDAGVVGISNTNMVLGFGPHTTQDLAHHWWLYDGNTHDLIPVQSLLANTPWTMDRAQIDPEGRLLVQAFVGSSPQAHELLLTPEGLVTPTSVPEPTTFATLVVAIGWLALRRRRAKHTKGTGE
jgi:hypothetical protein